MGLFVALWIFSIAWYAADVLFYPMQLRELIRRAGMTQVYVAARMGMKPSWFNRVCLGRSALRASQLYDLAIILRLPVDEVAQALSETKGQTDGEESTSGGGAPDGATGGAAGTGTSTR